MERERRDEREGGEPYYIVNYYSGSREKDPVVQEVVCVFQLLSSHFYLSRLISVFFTVRLLQRTHCTRPMRSYDIELHTNPLSSDLFCSLI